MTSLIAPHTNIQVRSPDTVPTPSKFKSKDIELRLANIGQSFCKVLDLAEREPVVFDGSLELMDLQRKTFQSYLSAAKVVENILHGYDSPKIEAYATRLARRVAGLKYRIEASNGGLDKSSFNPELLKDLIKCAQEWKSDEILYPEKELSRRDIQKLVDTCAYPEFAQALLRNKNAQKLFFIWCLRDNNGVRQYVEFPSITRRVQTAYLGERVGKLGADYFSITKQNAARYGSKAQEKIITLPFNTTHKTQPLSVMDESLKVKLNGGWELTINEIFGFFGRKHRETTDLEFFGPTGITNWHIFELGPWNPELNDYARQDFTNADWWQQLPVFEEITKQELQERYEVKLDKGESLVCVAATRKRPNWHIEDRHGYSVPCMPTPEGKYRIYPMGSYPLEFPTGIIEGVKVLAKYMQGKFVYPDYNYFLSNRQQAVHVIKPKNRITQFIEHLRKEFLQSQKGQFTFQVYDDNCAHVTQRSIHTLFEEEKPNYFKARFALADSKNPFLAKLLKWIGKLSEKNQQRVVRTILTVLGGKNSLTIINEEGQPVQKVVVKKNAQDEALVHFNPSHLFQQIEEGKLSGKITYGH